MDQHNDPPQLHVDTGGEESGSHQQQRALEDIRAEGPIGRLVRGDGATDVADCLD